MRTFDPAAIDWHAPHLETGMGSFLSTITLGLIKDKPKAPPPPTQQETMGQVAAVVLQTLNAQGWSAPIDKATASAGYVLNSLAAWDRIYTDASGATTKTIVDQVVNALIESGLVTWLPTSGGSGVVTPGAGSPAVTAPLPVSLSGNSQPLLIAGAILAAVVLLKRRRRGR